MELCAEMLSFMCRKSPFREKVKKVSFIMECHQIWLKKNSEPVIAELDLMKKNDLKKTQSEPLQSKTLDEIVKGTSDSFLSLNVAVAF